MRIRNRKSVAATSPASSPINDLDSFVNSNWVSNLDEMYNVAKIPAATVVTAAPIPADVTTPVVASAPIAALITALSATEGPAASEAHDDDVVEAPVELPVAMPAPILTMVPPPPPAPPAPIAIAVEPTFAPPAPPAPVPPAPVEVVVADTAFEVPAVAEVVMFDEFLRPRRH